MKKLKNLLATALVTGLLLVPSVASAASFKDVTTKHPQYNEIERMKELGIISGMGDGTFKPNNSVTRGQMAKMIGGTLGDGNPTIKYKFTDVQPASYYAKYLDVLVDKGAIAKVQKYNPNQNTTNGQMAKILAISFDLKGGDNIKLATANANKHWSAPHVRAMIHHGILSKKEADSMNLSKNMTRGELALYLNRILNNAKYDKVESQLGAMMPSDKLAQANYTKFKIETKRALQGFSYNEKIKIAYDYAFREMFSEKDAVKLNNRLYDMLNGAGVAVEKVSSNGHTWLVVTLDTKEKIIVDVGLDVKMKNQYRSLGATTADYANLLKGQKLKAVVPKNHPNVTIKQTRSKNIIQLIKYL